MQLKMISNQLTLSTTDSHHFRKKISKELIPKFWFPISKMILALIYLLMSNPFLAPKLVSFPIHSTMRTLKVPSQSLINLGRIGLLILCVQSISYPLRLKLVSILVGLSWEILLVLQTLTKNVKHWLETEGVKS